MKASPFSPLLALFLLALPGAAAAQTVPSSAEPSRVTDQIAPMAPKASAAAGPTVSAATPAEAPQGAEKIKLKLTRIVIEDMTVYRPEQVEPLYRDMIGKTVSLADVFGIAARLTVKYRNDGYILTQVILPPQTIDGGVVRLRVVEGYADKVTVEGPAAKELPGLRGYAERLRAAKPLNAAALERYMLLLNDLPGVSARAVLSPAKTPGASDIAIVVDRKPYDLFFQADNRGSRYIGPVQYTAGAHLNDWLGLREGITLQAATAPKGWPQRELTFGTASWQQPLGYEGTKLTLSGGISSTYPGYTLSAFDISGIARTAALQLEHPFLRSRNLSLTGSAKLDYLNSFRTDNLGLGPTNDKVRVLRAGAQLQWADRFEGANTLKAELSKGLDVLGASQKGDAGLSRPRGDPQFFKATAEATRLQHLGGPFSLYGAITGQKSADILLASEEFGVGGIAYGSAYDSSEITGEDGAAARLELRADNLVRTPLDLLQVYGFYDAGQVWDRDNSSAQDRIRALASAGAGFRAALNTHLSGSFEAAKPLTRPVATENDKDMRFFGALTLRY